MVSNPWLFDDEQLNKTPSIKEGLPKIEEQAKRTKGAQFIIRVGTNELNLHHCTVATGTVYFHRFYMYHSFSTFPMYPMAAACLFLAGKAEETPKKSHDLIRHCRSLLSDEDFATFHANGIDPKEELLTLERILLQTLRFDLEIEHPYDHLLKYVSHLILERDGQDSGVVKRALIQMAWGLLNDSRWTTFCLQYEPEIIAIALLYFCFKTGCFNLVDWDNRTPAHENWWDAYAENLDDPILEKICHKLLDLYEQQSEVNPSASISTAAASSVTTPTATTATTTATTLTTATTVAATTKQPNERQNS